MPNFTLQIVIDWEKELKKMKQKHLNIMKFWPNRKSLMLKFSLEIVLKMGLEQNLMKNKLYLGILRRQSMITLLQSIFSKKSIIKKCILKKIHFPYQYFL